MQQHTAVNERKSRKKQRRQAAAANEFQAIGFRIGKEEYGLPISSVQEIITTPHVTRVPKSPAHVMGVINLHGNVIPVIDIARRFEIGAIAPGAASRIVVVEVDGEVVGLAVESVSNVTRLPADQVKPPPPLVSGIAAEYLEGVARLDGRFLIFLNIRRVLDERNESTE